MLARGPGLLTEALVQRRAVPGFTVYTLESIRAVCDVAERAGLPVILQARSSSYRETSRRMLAAASRDSELPWGERAVPHRGSDPTAASNEWSR
jgi:fructose/tagatose bisphosphate aldolase